MSYHVLGNSCTHNTNAITNNRKFILPGNNVYYKEITNMYRFPVAHRHWTGDTKDYDPYNLRAFYSKNSQPGVSESQRRCCS
jgi:hypothetical protein